MMTKTIIFDYDGTIHHTIGIYEPAFRETYQWLTEQKAFSQILIFTCHHREAEMLESLNCDYHYVEL